MSVSASLPSGTEPGLGARVQRRAASLAAKPLFWMAVVLVGLGIPVLNQILRPPVPPLPVLGTLGSFALTDHNGRPFGPEEVRGKVWVAGFIFTRCPTICPAITATMGKVQKRARGIANDFRLVSFSVDPGFDTPERLATYARAHRASPRMWHFVTGPLDAIRTTVVDGMKIAMGDPPGENDFASLMHGTHFVLVDRALRIRGYYDSTDPNVADRLLHDAAMLINRGE